MILDLEYLLKMHKSINIMRGTQALQLFSMQTLLYLDIREYAMLFLFGDCKGNPIISRS